MNKLASIISGTFLLAGVANAGDAIELTAAQMDHVTAGYVFAASYAGGSFGGYGVGVAGASETATQSSAGYYYGPYVSTSGYNVTVSGALYGSIYGDSHSASVLYIGY
jgi:hypothetical protein